MSNFNCPLCNTEIIDTPGGPYITGCEHYPLESLNSETKKAPVNILETALKLAKDYPDHTHNSYLQGREDGIREFLKYCKEHYWDSVTSEKDMIICHLEQIQNQLLNQKKDESRN